MFAWFDRLSAALAWLAAWLFVATGVMLVYEVVARYVFVAPTVWAEELSRLALVWGVFLAASRLLRTRAHIHITILTERFGGTARRIAELASLAVVFALSAVALWYGGAIALDSLERGSTTGTMLDLPMLVTEAAVPIGFGLLGIQALIEIVRLLAGQAPPSAETSEGH